MKFILTGIMHVNGYMYSGLPIHDFLVKILKLLILLHPVLCIYDIINCKMIKFGKIISKTLKLYVM